MGTLTTVNRCDITYALTTATATATTTTNNHDNVYGAVIVLRAL